MFKRFLGIFALVFSQSSFAGSIVSIANPGSGDIVPLNFTVSTDWDCAAGSVFSRIDVVSPQVACGTGVVDPVERTYDAPCICEAGATSGIEIAAKLYCQNVGSGVVSLQSTFGISNLSCFDDNQDFCCRTGDPNNMYVWTTQLQCIKNGGSPFEAERFKCPLRPVVVVDPI